MSATVEELVNFLKASEAEFLIVDEDRFKGIRHEKISRPNSLYDSGVGEFTFLSRTHQNLVSTQVEATLVFTETIMSLNLSHGLEIRISNARFWFSRVANRFFPALSHQLIPFGNAIKDNRYGLTIGTDCHIDSNVVIGRNVRLGNAVRIGPGSVLHSNVQIDDGSVLGASCVIGGIGFGIERLGNEVERMPHYGKVVIGKNVSIGSNSCIDRGVFSDTIIGNQVQIDNLVHVAHGAVVGDSTFLVAGSLICGSVKIGKRVWIGGNASIKEGLSIGDDSLIGLGAVVLRDVQSGERIVGNPGRSLES